MVNICVVLKYKNKCYNSDDVPLFLYFKSVKNKEEFIDLLANYDIVNEYVLVNCVDIALAGNTVVKGKRAKLYINIPSKEEKREIQRYLFDSNDESNAVISTPPDIKPSILEKWIGKHTKDLI